MKTKFWKDSEKRSSFIQTEIEENNHRTKFSRDIFGEVTNIIIETLAKEYLNRYKNKIFKKLSIKQIRNTVYTVIAKEIEKRLFDKKEEECK